MTDEMEGGRDRRTNARNANARNANAHHAAARSAPDLEALRAAVARIEQGESTGFFDEIAPVSGSPEFIEQEEDSSTDDPAGGVQTSQTETTGPENAASSSADRDAADGDEADPGTEEDRDADPYAVARNIVLRQLTMSPKSRQQLRQKLRQRNCPDDVAEAVLDRMSEVGLVDDEKYAEAYVRSKQTTRGLSARALAHELRTKGVDRDTAETVLAEIRPVEEEERARSLVDARLPRLRGLDRQVVIRRLAGMLARKGYPSGLSLQVIREAIDADPTFARD